ncbi:MAG: carboxypeptidase-like regulatory domain-containing protein, partial [Massilibacteroides sp.]|nr:carboxypeptidase-like regulatory domain-containing protein [Massilibacteroides sp.]
MKHIFLKFIFSSLFFIAFMGGVKSQTIEGVVLNESNKPLPGATVSIKTHNLAMSTNDKGEFNFTKVPIGEVRLRVTFIGYKPQEKTIEITETSTKKLNFNMEIESTELSEVSVIGTSGGANNIEKISK